MQVKVARLIPVLALRAHGDIPEVVVGDGHGLAAPLGHDGVVEDLLVPIGLVGQTVHNAHHGELADHEHHGIGRGAVRMGTNWVKFVVPLRVVPQWQAEPWVLGHGSWFGETADGCEKRSTDRWHERSSACAVFISFDETMPAYQHSAGVYKVGMVGCAACPA